MRERPERLPRIRAAARRESDGAGRGVVVRGGAVDEARGRMFEGWVSVARGTGTVDVCLLLNGREIMRTRATARDGRIDDDGDVRGFRFITRDLPRYLGPGDRLSVQAAGSPIPIAGHGMQFQPPEQGRFTSDELFAHLSSGFILSRIGLVQRSRKDDVQWQDAVTEIAQRLIDWVGRQVGYEVFYTYGSMLGAVRERGFLGFDDDLDLGYVSRHADGEHVATELRDLALALIADGWAVEPFPAHLHVIGDVDGQPQRVDLFPYFFDGDGVLRTPFGMAGSRYLLRSEWKGVHQTPFESRTAPIPVAAEAMLEQFYGGSWREPQPGFNWPRDRTDAATEGWLSDEQQQEIYWTDWHARFGFDRPSPFFAVVSSRPDCPRVVLDLGCGDGRDAVAFAATGRRVVAVDRAEAALAAARRKLDERGAGLQPAVEVRRADLLTDELDPVLAEVIAAADDEPVLFYLRFVLHTWTPEDDKPLLDALRSLARPGDLLAAEFRSLRDEGRRKTHPSTLRVFRNGNELAQRLRFEYGATVLEQGAGVGRSPYEDENPSLYRIIARF